MFFLFRYNVVTDFNQSLHCIQRFGIQQIVFSVSASNRKFTSSIKSTIEIILTKLRPLGPAWATFSNCPCIVLRPWFRLSISFCPTVLHSNFSYIFPILIRSEKTGPNSFKLGLKYLWVKRIKSVHPKVHIPFKCDKIY